MSTKIMAELAVTSWEERPGEGNLSTAVVKQCYRGSVRFEHDERGAHVTLDYDFPGGAA
jgi:hypothetical protein